MWEEATLDKKEPRSTQEVAPCSLDQETVTHVGRDLQVTVLLNCHGIFIMKNILVQRGVSPLKDCVQVGLPIAGRLAVFPKNWLKVTQDQWVLNIVQGYRLQLHWEPAQSFHPRGVITSSSQDQSLVYEEIQKPIRKGAIT